MSAEIISVRYIPGNSLLPLQIQKKPDEIYSQLNSQLNGVLIINLSQTLLKL
jgi:hypothetical protein